MDAAATFWRTYFDAEVGEQYHSRRQQGFVSRFATLPGNTARIELMAAPWVDDAPVCDRIGWTHVAVGLDSEEAVDRLAARCGLDGCLVAAPRTTGDGFYEAIIAMPDGTPIEVTA